MLLDLIAILFIVLLSFILCFKDKDYKCQISHIIMGLSVIVFYKLAKYFQLQDTQNTIQNTIQPKIEHFDDNTTNLINDFLNGNQQNIVSQSQASTMSSSDLTNYNNKLQQLIDALQTLNNNNQPATSPTIISANPSSLSKMDLESQQQYQMFVIDYLNNQLNNAKEIINQQSVANVSSNYKPIKVYSSCVISNANGTNTIQQVPVSGNSSTSMTPNQQMMQTISQSATTNGPVLSQSSNFMDVVSSSGSSSNPLNLAPTTGSLGNLVNKVLSGKTVNFNIM